MGIGLMLVALVLLLGACAVDPGYQGRSSGAWIKALDDANPETRADAASALGHILRLQPKSPAVVRALIRALGDSADPVRVAAGVALATEGVRVPDAVPGLIDALRDSAHADMREHAAQILGAFGSTARPAVPALSVALADEHVEVRAAAAEALRRIGPAASGATPALVRLAADPMPALRQAALEALTRVEAPAATIVPVFVAALRRDSSSSVRASAAYALAALGRAAVSAAPAATRALRDDEPGVRVAAAYALAEMGPGARAAVPALTAAMRDPSPAVVAAASDALAAVQGRPRPPRPHYEP